jgi:hypothetical protein
MVYEGQETFRKCRIELLKDEVCDATDDDSSNKDDKIKIIF